MSFNNIVNGHNDLEMMMYDLY